MGDSETMMDTASLETLLVDKTGLRIKPEMRPRLSDHVDKLMRRRAVKDLNAYMRLLGRDPNALQEVIDYLTVNETYFFREPAQIGVFVQTLVPEIMRRKSSGEKVRVLSAGCATGEEPYSLAIALAEQYKATRVRDRFHLAGVDIDRMAIEKARKGIYGQGSFRRFDSGLLSRYFDPCRDRVGGRIIRPEIRRLIDFRRGNLLEAPYPDDLKDMDVVFYRNVSIYFDAVVRKRIFRNLSKVLLPGGFLILSATETLSHDFHLLDLVERDGLFLYVKTRSEGSREAAAGRIFSPPPPIAPKPPAAPPDSPRSNADRYAEALETAATRSRGDALKRLDSLIADAPDFIPAKTLKAAILAYRDAARIDEAETLCEAALALDPWCVEAQLLMGIVAKIRDDRPEAIKRFKAVVYNRTDNWLAHFYLAGIYQAEGQDDRARREYGIAARLLEKGRFPDHGLAFFPLAFSEEQIIYSCRENIKRDVR